MPRVYGFSILLFIVCFGCSQRQKPMPVRVKITAHKYAFEPSVIHVRQGDEVELEISTSDVQHGLRWQGGRWLGWHGRRCQGGRGRDHIFGQSSAGNEPITHHALAICVARPVVAAERVQRPITVRHLPSPVRANDRFQGSGQCHVAGQQRCRCQQWRPGLGARSGTYDVGTRRMRVPFRREVVQRARRRCRQIASERGIRGDVNCDGARGWARTASCGTGSTARA